MQGFQSLFVALVASMALVSTTAPSAALASQVDVPYHHYHAARGHNSVRSVVLDHGKKLKAKRATQAQQEAAARAKQWSENFAKQNSAWQAAANEDLKNGKTPQDFDTWAASNGGRDGHGNDSPDSSSSSGSKSDNGSSQSDNSSQKQDNQDNQEEDDGDDEADEYDEGDDNSSSSSSQQAPSSTSAQSSAPTAAKKKQAYTQDSEAKKNNNKQSSSKSSSSSSSGSGLLAGIKNLVTGGQVTYYNTGLGACGWTNKDSDYIVALPVGVWNRIGGSVSNGNIVCGKKLKVSNGQTAIEVEITDQCPSCDDKHLDLSPSAFSALGDQSKGVLPVSWGWVDGEPSK